MKSFNHGVFVGHVGKEPEERTVKDDVKVCDFSLAVDEGKDQAPLWLTVVAWRKLAEQVKSSVHTGDLLLVSGKLRIRTYTTKTNVEKTAVEVIATDIRFLSPKDRTKEAAPVEDGAPPEPAMATAA